MGQRNLQLRSLRQAPEFKMMAETIRAVSNGHRLVYVPNDGSLGDGLMNAGARQFLDYFGLSYKELSRAEVRREIMGGGDTLSDAVLLYAAGGAWCELWRSGRKFVEEIADQVARVIVLPTTYELPPLEFENVSYFRRDNELSLKMNPTATFCHDLGFFLDLEIAVPQNPLRVLRAFRGDKEGLGFSLSGTDNMDLSRQGNTELKDPVAFLQVIGAFQSVETDRLNIGIAAALLGLPVTLYPTAYPKNEGVFNATISQNYDHSTFADRGGSRQSTVANDGGAKSHQPVKRSEAGIWKIVSTSPLVLPVNSRLYRNPPRRPVDFSEDYLFKYDGHTLAADCYMSGDDLRMVGPPLLNLAKYVDESSLELDGVQPANQPRWEDLNRISRFRLRVDENVSKLRLEFGPETLSVSPSPDMTRMFDGANVLVTLNKDNHLENVADWVRNYVQNHEVDSVIFYDNRSETYSLSDILHTLKQVPGLENAVVVDWPYKYGNTGGPKQIWDSDFGQYMCWEHARWRFARFAKTVIINDVDEFPVSASGKSLPQLVEESPNGVYRYALRDTPALPRLGLERKAGEVRRHSDYAYVATNARKYSSKYAYSPQRLSDRIQVGNHEVFGVRAPIGNDVIGRHCQGLHASWRKGDFSYSHKESDFDSAKFVEDRDFIRQLQRTFPERF